MHVISALQSWSAKHALTEPMHAPLTEQFMAPMNKIKFLKKNLEKLDMGPNKDDIIHALASKCTSAELRAFCADVTGTTMEKPMKAGTIFKQM